MPASSNSQRIRSRFLAEAWAAAWATAAAGGLLGTSFAAATTLDGDIPSVVRLPENPQRDGDPVAGLEYLLYGDYIGSGLPLRFFQTLTRGSVRDEPLIAREGAAAGLSHELNAFAMPDGTEVVAAVNCLGCHAQVLGDELVIGLGNSLSDWTEESRTPVGAIREMIRVIYPPEHPERLAAETFLRGASVIDGKVAAPFRGVNPAFRLEEIAAAHRRPGDLSWSEEPLYEYPERIIASDVPPWWNVKKKNALYYNGLGRGDFGKLIQQINVVAIGDATDAARINRSMDDLLAFVRSIEPPPYPGPIDAGLAADGAVVFERNCAKCHGTYGDEWTYPNKLVSIDEVGTDPEYARALTTSGLHEWFNESWYATTEPTARAEPTMAYIAPPLDGIWATAPYFHNGSVPTLEAVLDSSARPTFWRREFDPGEYDPSLPGWRHTVEDSARDLNTYDTTRPGFGNGGHTYGDDLSDSERQALIEYLKSL